MRLAALLSIGLLLAVSTTSAAATPEEVARARVLDQQGVRAYKEGRYNDAIKYFGEAFKLGGPPSELWNIAKCHLRLDEPENAADAYERYLMQPGLSPQDKAEARGELDELRHRRSIVTVASAPTHATVYVDGNKSQPAGTTPFSLQVTAGTHKVEIEQKGYKPYAQDIDAKLGRAVIVDAQLEVDPVQQEKEKQKEKEKDKDKDKEREPEKPVSEDALDAPRRFSATGEVGFVFSKLGALAEGARFGLGFGATYWIVDGPKGVFGIGAHLDVTSDSWGNTVGAPSTATNCSSTTIQNAESATEIAGYAVGAFAYRLSPRLRLGADAGLGLAGYNASTVGGDLFYPSCQPAPGAQIAARAAMEVSFTVVPMVRVVGTPLAVTVHPSYAGARPTPQDATGAWVRFGLGLGMAVDL